jgi:hypothetical protein
MKKHMSIVSCMVAVAGFASVASAQVRISQLYVGGGFSTAPASVFQNDYIELFNPTNTAISLNGWSLQKAAVTGTNWSGRIVFGASDTIPANGYFLVQCNTSAAPTQPLITPTPDRIGTNAGDGSNGIDMSASGTGGTKVVLLRPGAPIPIANTVSNPLTDATVSSFISDFVGVGTANAFEGTAPAPQPQLNGGTPAGQWAIVRGANGCNDTNNNQGDFLLVAIGSGAGQILPRNSASPTNNCNFVDCNGNSINDATEIAGNPSLDCNTNGTIDSCELNSTTDCNANSQLDVCEIAGNALLDRNTNGIIDSCEIAQFADLDSCNNNGIIDQFDTPGAGQDCNANGVIDCWEIKLGQLTDVDTNGVSDVCEGAIVVEATVSAYTQGAAGTPPRDGITNETSGSTFFNTQNLTSTTAFYGYGIARFDNAAVATAAPGRIYLALTQSNAGFTRPQVIFPGDPDNVQVFYSDSQDSTVITPGTNTPNNNLPVAGWDNNTLFADRALAGSYLFVQGSNPPPAIPFGGSSNGNGTRDSIKLYDASQTNTAGGEAIRNEVAGGTGVLTLVVNHAPNAIGAVAATYAGTNNINYRGPSLVVFPGGPVLPTCGSIDFNRDGLFPDDSDLVDFLNVLAGGICSTDPEPGCDTIDFNGDGLFPDDNDLIDFLIVLAGGQPVNCTP